jgi:hypothetical protein
MAAHNRLAGGSSPLSPTTQSYVNRDFPIQSPELAGIRASPGNSRKPSRKSFSAFHQRCLPLLTRSSSEAVHVCLWHYGPARKADDRRLDISALTDDQLDELRDQLDGGEEYDDDGNRDEVERIADLLIAANPAMTKQRALHSELKDVGDHPKYRRSVDEPGRRDPPVPVWNALSGPHRRFQLLRH